KKKKQVSSKKQSNHRESSKPAALSRTASEPERRDDCADGGGHLPRSNTVTTPGRMQTSKETILLRFEITIQKVQTARAAHTRTPLGTSCGYSVIFYHRQIHTHKYCSQFNAKYFKEAGITVCHQIFKPCT
uniref:Uncharacterized protein n=1 Tax=Amphilophus citrinellus TaxID=61819 RepID=A0A3Q0RPU0_AMPCI